MSITTDDVKHMASLAKLEIDSQQADFYVDQLNQILQLVNQMQDIDTTGIKPMSHPQNATLRLREDVVTETNRRDDYQAISPETDHGLYLVPKVIE